MLYFALVPLMYPFPSPFPVSYPDPLFVAAGRIRRAIDAVQPSWTWPAGDVGDSGAQAAADHPDFQIELAGKLNLRGAMTVVVFDEITVEPDAGKSVIELGGNLGSSLIGGMVPDTGTPALDIAARRLGGIGAFPHLVEPGQEELDLLHVKDHGAGADPDELSLFIVAAHLAQFLLMLRRLGDEVLQLLRRHIGVDGDFGQRLGQLPGRLMRGDIQISPVIMPLVLHQFRPGLRRDYPE
jgi:hypothetical protein